MSGVAKLGNFSGNSARSASTFKAGFTGLSVSNFLKRSSWSKESRWQSFYNKDTVSNENIFRTKVFESGQRGGFKHRIKNRDHA